jgi:hypothetical protein
MTTSAGGDDGIFGDADKNRAPLIDLQGGEASLGDVERGNVVVRIEMPIEREELRQIRGPNEWSAAHPCEQAPYT